MTREPSLLYTGAERNFTCLSSLSKEWIHRIQKVPAAGILDANERPILVVRAIQLCPQLGTQLFRDEFLICERFAAPFLIRCSHMDSYVRSIFPGEKIILLQYS